MMAQEGVSGQRKALGQEMQGRHTDPRPHVSPKGAGATLEQPEGNFLCPLGRGQETKAPGRQDASRQVCEARRGETRHLN